MRLLTDHYVNRDSFFHRWHPTYKLIGHLVLMMGIAVLDDLMAAGIALLMAMIFIPMTAIPVRAVWQRLRPALIFLAMFFVLLPLTGEGATVRIGPVSLSQDGIELAALVFLKAAAIVLLSVPMMATSRFDCLLKSLQQLGCPAKLVQIFLLTFRYNFVLAGEVESMGMAVASRGLRRGFNRPTFRALGQVVGSLLVRSKDRSLRLYDAMLARGHTGRVRTLHEHEVHGSDWMKMILFFALAILLVGIQWWR